MTRIGRRLRWKPIGENPAGECEQEKGEDTDATDPSLLGANIGLILRNPHTNIFSATQTEATASGDVKARVVSQVSVDLLIFYLDQLAHLEEASEAELLG